MRRARFPGKSNRGSIKNRVAVRSNAAPMPGEWMLFLDETFAWEWKLNPKELYNHSHDRKEEKNVLDNPEYKTVVGFLLKQAELAKGDNGSTRQLERK